MAIEKVRAYFAPFGLEEKILEFPVSSATVELAAKALGCDEARIAKTLSFKKEEDCILVVTAGDAKINNSKFKAAFGLKAKMLTPEEVLTFTGHAVGGVCPFGIENTHTTAYLDISLKRFVTVFPACGSANSAIELTPETLFNLSAAVAWVDVCNIKEGE